VKTLFDAMLRLGWKHSSKTFLYYVSERFR